MTDSNKVLTAVVAKVLFGKNSEIEIEGLLLEDGSFGVAVPQIAQLFPYFKTDTNNASILLKRLMGKDFKTDKVKTQFNKNITLAVKLVDFERVLRKLDKKSDPVAETFIDALIGLSLHQLFSDAFKIKFEEEDRQLFLDTRLKGKMTRRTFTDAIDDYIARHNKSERYITYVYAVATNAIYRKIFGKSAIDLRIERKVSQHLPLRDFMTTEELDLIDRIEAHAVILVDKSDIEPEQAGHQAGRFYCS